MLFVPFNLSREIQHAIIALLMATLLIGICACNSISTNSSGKNELTWQEQYDLGIRYLSEGNYEEAIIAFAVAIEIDSKRAPAYVGRGDAYILSFRQRRTWRRLRQTMSRLSNWMKHLWKRILTFPMCIL